MSLLHLLWLSKLIINSGLSLIAFILKLLGFVPQRQPTKDQLLWLSGLSMG